MVLDPKGCVSVSSPLSVCALRICPNSCSDASRKCGKSAADNNNLKMKQSIMKKSQPTHTNSVAGLMENSVSEMKERDFRISYATLKLYCSAQDAGGGGGKSFIH